MFNKTIASGAAAAALCAALAAAPAQATPVTATLTADNFYALYKGALNPAGEGDLTLVGRNESTYGHQSGAGNPNSLAGCSGSYNWSCPEVFDFDLAAGETFYVAVWDDGTVAESWIGQFMVGATTYLSNQAEWQYFIIDIANPAIGAGGGSGPMPALSQILANVQDANDDGDGDAWLDDPYSRGLNGTAPWGLVSGISSDALFLSSLSDGGQVSNPRVSLYRLEFAPGGSSLRVTEAPEPAAFGLFAVGLFAVAALRRRARPARARR